MTDANQKKRKWAAYTCPLCRFVFRVPKDHEGVGVICPACHYLLNLPQEEKRSPLEERTPRSPALNPNKPAIPGVLEPQNTKDRKPILSRAFNEGDSFGNESETKKPTPSSIEKNLESHQESSTAAPRRRVRRKKHSSDSQPSWEHRKSSSSGGGSSKIWIVGGVVIGLLVVAVGIWVIMGASATNPENSARSPIVQNLDPQSQGKVALTDEEKLAQEELKESVNTSMNVMVDSQKYIRAFLTAKNPSDLESLVRTPDVTIPRMKKWYTQHKWTPPGAKEICIGGKVTVKGLIASMAVRLNDYSVTPIAVERTSDGYLIDWESWVAWSEMDWAELFKKRPTQLIEVRVTAVGDNYYNRFFKDDEKWLAVRLEYPNADRSIYGYIDKKNSKLTSLIGDLKGEGGIPVTLKIRYTEDSVADNQVIIEEYIQNGWVRPVKSQLKKDDTASPQ